MICKIAKLGDICKIQSGNSIPVKEKKVLYKNIDEGLPYVATKDVGFDGVINYENGVRIPPIHSSKFRLSKKNSILVCAEGGSAGRKIAFSDKDCHFVNKLFSICPGNEMVSKYVYYYTLSSNFQSQFKKAMNGLIGGVSISKIKSFQIKFPPLSEQQNIVTKLDSAFVKIAKKTNNMNQNIKNAKELEVKFILKELDKLDKSNLKKLSSVCDLTRGPFGGSLTKSMFVQKGFAIYEQKHAIKNNFEIIKYFISEEKFNEMKRFELRAGDLLMSCSGTLGRIAIVPENIKRGIINQALLKITPNKSIISKEYLKLVIISDYFQKILWNMSEGAAQVNVPAVKILKNILIPVPVIKKQEEIIKKISTLNNLRLESLYIQKKDLLESLKASIVDNFLNINNKAA